MASKRARLAVSSLVSYLDANLSTYLRAIETEDAIAANSLGNPVQVIGAYVPNDTRSRLLQVFAETGENEDDFGVGGGISKVDCTIVFAYNSSVGAEDSEAYCWRWVDAICDAIVADGTLGGLVTGCIWTDYDRTYSIIDESTTRHIRAVGVEVTVC